jgi:hypothetical protein
MSFRFGFQPPSTTPDNAPRRRLYASPDDPFYAPSDLPLHAGLRTTSRAPVRALVHAGLHTSPDTPLRTLPHAPLGTPSDECFDMSFDGCFGISSGGCFGTPVRAPFHATADGASCKLPGDTLDDAAEAPKRHLRPTVFDAPGVTFPCRPLPAPPGSPIPLLALLHTPPPFAPLATPPAPLLTVLPWPIRRGRGT